MQIKIYLLFILSTIFLHTTSKAQELFPKKELYHVWILAEQKLDVGQFDDALRLYNTHKENLNFAVKIRQVSRLKEISSEAEKLRRRGAYAEAVDKYKEYRKLKDMSTIGVFEKKIGVCLIKINQGKLTELTSQQRIITGFEWAHRGRQKLSQLDTIGAKRDFNNARILGGNRNNVLKEQYVEGNRIVDALTKWGQEKAKMEKAVMTGLQELAFLQTYRDIRNIDIPAVELKIKEIRNGLDGPKSMTDIARLCDLDLLINYVKSHKSEISSSTSLTERLNEYKSTQNKINLLKKNTDNAATVQSAYQSMLSWISDFPVEIRNDLKACLKREQHQTFSDYSKIAKNNDDVKAAARFEKMAQQSISDPDSISSSDVVVDVRSCKGTEDFIRGIVLVRRELSNCNVLRAKSVWIENLSYLKGCSEAGSLMAKNKSLRDSVFLMSQNDSLIVSYQKQIQQLISKGACSETVPVYEKMKLVRVCNQDVIDEEIEIGLLEAEKCKKNSWWKPEMTGSFAAAIPKYSVAGVTRKMENGYSASAGAQISYIDHKNPVDFILGAEYFTTAYSSLGTLGSILEDYKLSGVNGILAIKLHQANTNPSKIRPYLKMGAEILIPVSYAYESFSTFSKVSGTDQLQKTILSVTGALGLEIQKQHFGAFIEGFGNYALPNSIYNSDLSHIVTAQNQKVESRIVEVGVRVGLRLW